MVKFSLLLVSYFHNYCFDIVGKRERYLVTYFPHTPLRGGQELGLEGGKCGHIGSKL